MRENKLNWLIEHTKTDSRGVQRAAFNVRTVLNHIWNIITGYPRLDFRRLRGPVFDPLIRGMSAGSFFRTAAGIRA